MHSQYVFGTTFGVDDSLAKEAVRPVVAGQHAGSISSHRLEDSELIALLSASIRRLVGTHAAFHNVVTK